MFITFVRKNRRKYIVQYLGFVWNFIHTIFFILSFVITNTAAAAVAVAVCDFIFYYFQFGFGAAIFLSINLDGLTTATTNNINKHTHTQSFIIISSPIKVAHKMRKRPLYRFDIVFILFQQQHEKHSQAFPKLQTLCQNFNNYLVIRCVCVCILIA